MCLETFCTKNKFLLFNRFRRPKNEYFESILTIIVMRIIISHQGNTLLHARSFFNFPCHFPSLLGKFNFDCALRRKNMKWKGDGEVETLMMNKLKRKFLLPFYPQ